MMDRWAADRLQNSITVTGVAVRGDLGWWKLEDRREKVLYGKGGK